MSNITLGIPNWDNKTLFIHDNLPVMRGMDSATVDLIYLDPPFNSKRLYLAKEGSQAAGAKFNDIWRMDAERQQEAEILRRDEGDMGRALHAIIRAAGLTYDESMEAYLTFMAVRLKEMQRILKPTGSIYLHCDPTASHYLKLVMDAVFGKGNFRNEIVWCYPPGGKGPKYGFHRKHDNILFYGGGGKHAQFSRPYGPMPDSTKARFTGVDADGRRFKNYPGGRVYLDESLGRPVPDWWDDIPSLGQAIGKENTGYPTQKPVKLLHRIIEASSNEGDVVFDPFCGCATTLVTAEMLGRQWVGIDLSQEAIDLNTQRMAALQGETPEQYALHRDFVVRTAPPGRNDDEPTLTSKEKKEWLAAMHERNGGICPGPCGREVELGFMELDRKEPGALGGKYTKGNTQPLCVECHRKKGSKSWASWLAMLAAAKGDSPTPAPVPKDLLYTGDTRTKSALPKTKREYVGLILRLAKECPGFLDRFSQAHPNKLNKNRASLAQTYRQKTSSAREIHGFWLATLNSGEGYMRCGRQALALAKWGVA